MNNQVLPEDLRVFAAVTRRSSFAAAASELGVSPAYVTKRIRLLEAQLEVRLFHRTTRRVVISEDGERVYAWAQKILDNIDHLYDEVAMTRATPRGRLRICSSFGFGRRVVAPAIAELVTRYPEIEVRFEVFDHLIDIAREGFDIDVRVGDEIAGDMMARRLAMNHRVLCAAPAYLARRGAPRSVAELAGHDCLVIKERDHQFGVWTLHNGRQKETVKVTGPLSSNNGEIVMRWALDGKGIALRSVWDARPHIARGELVQVLPACRQDANIWAVYPSRLTSSAKVRVCVEFFEEYFRREAAGRR
ncbi:MAG TPA: LysR substrate-binding domain-containing protein [Noviherbaspirillum sp.]|uniref:LysR substrate-binding domain-containing protein n=1 Tax=Noviherbaspirillum sp. TaxID=1926288 RepID=UPI002F92DE47